MPYPAPHNVLQIYGSHAHGSYADIWTMTLRLGKDGGGGAFFRDVATAEHVADIKTDLATWWNSMSFVWPTTVKMRGFKFNAVDVDGRYISDETTVGGDWGATGLAGTASAAQLPPQLAVAVTLHTDTARGLANKGRIYLPPFATTNVREGGVLHGPDLPVFSEKIATLLTSLGNWPGIDATGDAGDVVVASKVRGGAMRKVTGVSIGTVFDTQRRRRSAYKEVHNAPVAVA